MPLGGSFRAWISSSTTSPASDGSFTKGTGPYELINGTQIAADWNDLIDGDLSNSITLTEQSGGGELGFVWTSTNGNGTAVSGTADAFFCSDWTSNNSAFGGLVGDSSGDTDNEWSLSFGQPDQCDLTRRLYCFEQ